jgi:caspase domain-containing protein/ankyrin repeat protein
MTGPGRQTHRIAARSVAIVTIVLVVAAMAFCRPATAEQRVALVIGNAAYATIPALTNPANDAALMAATLGDVGFEVVTAPNADRDEMAAAIREFGKRLRAAGPDAVGLFYYAGHGVQAGGINYLIPVDAPIGNEADLETAAVSAQWVLSQMAYAGNALNIVILDACRNNPFAGGFRSLESGLARMDAPSGALVAYAAGPGQTAADGTGALADAMRTPGLDLEGVFKRVRVAVESTTGRAQTPWEESSLTGDFFFVPSAAPAAKPAAPAADQTLDLAFWNSIKDSTNPASFEAYLQQFPNGAFSRLARVRLSELGGAQSDRQSAPVASGHDDLGDAAYADDLAAVKAYLARGADIDARDRDGDTPLHLAAIKAGPAVIAALVAAGADPNAGSTDGNTPLFNAAENGNLPAVKALLAAGGKVNARNKDGHTPLFYAIDQGHRPVVEVLLAAGADLAVRDKDGDTPLDLALYLKRDAIAGLLRAKGGRCNNMC